MPKETELQILLYSLESAVDNPCPLSTITRQQPLSFGRDLKTPQTNGVEWNNIDLEYFKDKFPRVDQWLAVRTANASCRRRQHLEYMKRNAKEPSQCHNDIKMTDHGTESYTNCNTHLNNCPVDPWTRRYKTRHCGERA